MLMRKRLGALLIRFSLISRKAAKRSARKKQPPRMLPVRRDRSSISVASERGRSLDLPLIRRQKLGELSLK